MLNWRRLGFIVIAASTLLTSQVVYSAGTAAVIARSSTIVQIDESQQGLAPAERTGNTALNQVTFSFNYGSGLAGNIAAQNAFAQAAGRWAALLGDNVNLILNLDFTSLSGGVLGETSASLLAGGLNTVRNIIAANNSVPYNAREAALYPLLPNASQFSVWLPEGYNLDGKMLITQANYLALGGSHLAAADGSISFNSDYSWDFDPSDGIDAGKYDFVGTATHEIGHVLGFYSELDYIDMSLHDGYTTLSNIEPAVMDMFRFAAADLMVNFDFTDSTRYLVPGGEQYFYYGDGTLALSTGRYDGDGTQASHFKDNLDIGIMDPTVTTGELLAITNNDLIVLDLLGWEIIPEPATICLLAAGMILIRKN